jgi:hypothetical protein
LVWDSWEREFVLAAPKGGEAVGGVAVEAAVGEAAAGVEAGAFGGVGVWERGDGRKKRRWHTLRTHSGQKPPLHSKGKRIREREVCFFGTRNTKFGTRGTLHGILKY